MKYKISHEANQDLKNIWQYTFKNWSIEQADKYINLMIDEIEFLAKNPDFGHNDVKIRKGYFRSRVKSHFIYYKVNVKLKNIEVVRILHQRMDINTRLR